MTDDSAPGWEAIDAALRRVYGEKEPRHYGPIIHARIGGPDPIDGTSIYEVESPSHWHYVTYGMSELYAKESENAHTSGWGFEFTFRLARHGEAEPPVWVMNFLNNLARYVFKTGNVFGVGHHLNLNGPIALEAETEIRAIAFAADPQLGRISTPNGSLEFLQVVGLTVDELEAIQTWNTKPFLDLLAKSNPLLLT